MGSKSYKFIALSEDNYSHLKELGSFGDSFNDIVSRLLSKNHPAPRVDSK